MGFIVNIKSFSGYIFDLMHEGEGGIVKHKYSMVILVVLVFSNLLIVYIMYIILYFSSFRGVEWFKERIEHRIGRYREKRVDPSFSILIPNPSMKVWGEGRTFSKIDMVGACVGFKPRINTKRDEFCMDKFLKKSKSELLMTPDIGSTRDYLPVGAPLLDYLVEDTKHIDGWKYPCLTELEKYQENRSLTYKVDAEVEVREIICGVSSEEECRSAHRWLRDMYHKDQDSFPSRIVSLDVEDVKVTFFDTLRMSGDLSVKAGQRIAREKDRNRIPGIEKDSWKQIPGKIMIGNGLTWMFVISLNLRRDNTGSYLVERMKVQDGLVCILGDLPVSAGLGVRRDIRGIEEFYTLISGSRVELKAGFLDLTTLAIVAGYKLHSKNMTCMGVQVLGSLLNKTVSTGDDLWGLPWNEIPAALRVYGIGDCRFGFMTYNVLAGIIMRDLFPDPDIVCRFLECNQKQAVAWFLDWLVLSLEGLEFHAGAEEMAESRGDMLRSLRFRNARDKLDGVHPKFVEIWCRLLGSWPSMTHGGCRFVIQPRLWFLEQICILGRCKIQWIDQRVLRRPDEDDWLYARFGLSQEQIGYQSWRNPVTRLRGLVRPPGINVALLEFDPSTTKNTVIGRRCTVLGRSQRWAILEWARLNPDKIRAFFARMIRDKGFRIFYRCIYDAMRLMHMRIFDTRAPRVGKVEDALCGSLDNVVIEERAALDRVAQEFKIRTARVSWVEGVRSDWEFKERPKWRAGMPALPAWKKKEGRKRGRSCSDVVNPKPKKRKKRNGGVKLGSVLVPVQPTNGGNVQGVVIGSGVVSGAPIVDGGEVDDAAEDVVMLDEEGGILVMSDTDDVLLTKKRRVSSRSKSVICSLERRVLTYDEQIEDFNRVLNDDDLLDDDFRFEIPEEVENIEV